MAKGHRNKQAAKFRSWQEQMALTLPALQTRAMDVAEGKGHLLGQWYAAKKKHGIGAQRTICVSCGLGVTILPRMWWGKMEVPAMRGDALFQPCAVDGEVVK